MTHTNENPRSGRGRGSTALGPVQGRGQYTASKPTRAAIFVERLCAEYPVFRDYRPLAIGIHLAIPRSAKKIRRRALALHCGRRRYLEALAAGGSRYALDGSACGEVTEPQREAARAKLDQVPVLGVAPPVLSLTKPRRRS